MSPHPSSCTIPVIGPPAVRETAQKQEDCIGSQQLSSFSSTAVSTKEDLMKNTRMIYEGYDPIGWGPAKKQKG